MFPELNNFLSLSSHSLKQRNFIGICDSNADSGFLFHHFISYFLKTQHRVFLVSFTQSFTHFNTVGNKTGTNLTEERKNSNFVFIEGLKHLGPAVNARIKVDNPWKDIILDGGKVNLRKFYELLRSLLDSFDDTLKPVLIIDNVSVLTDIGVSVSDLIGLISYLRSHICGTQDSCCVIGVNNDCKLEDEDGVRLWKALQYIADMKIEVKGLESGYCRDVHGQIQVEWESSSVREKSTIKEAQFKLTDKNCSLFAAGMSSAVL